MHESTSTKRNSFKTYAMAGALLTGLGATGAFLAGVTPATAAGFARTIDGQVAVFMVPLCLLMSAILFEVIRIAWRGELPGQTLDRRDASRFWRPGHGEG